MAILRTRNGGHWEKWLPTTKWWAATIAAAVTVATAAATGDGINTDDEWVFVIGIAGQRLLAYAARNAPAEGSKQAEG